jgi:hypothetical protein
LVIQDALAALPTDLFTRLLALRQLEEDLHLREQVSVRLTERQRVLDDGRRSLSQISHWLVSTGDEKVTEAKEKIRASHPHSLPSAKTIREHAIQVLVKNDGLREPIDFQTELIFVLLFLAWPVVWIIWAFLWRGGLSFFFLGLALVRWDGRPAGRWQCAWRASVFWAPVAALVVLSLWLDALYWSEWSPDLSHVWLAWLAWLAWWGGLALLFPGYLILALRSPERALHDRLAGTYLVPR